MTEEELDAMADAVWGLGRYEPNFDMGYDFYDCPIDWSGPLTKTWEGEPTEWEAQRERLGRKPLRGMARFMDDMGHDLERSIYGSTPIISRLRD